MRLVRARIGGEVDVPLALQIVNFGRPDVMLVRPTRGRSPDDLLRRGLQFGHAARLPQSQILDGRIHVVINAILEFDPGIGPCRK